MRLHHAVVFLAIALSSASATSGDVVVALAIEPEVAVSPAPTLESAARANDFATFDALYRANPNPAYRTLHELWSYSMTDRVGAFYGREQFERLAREYPGFAEYIEHYKIVDSHGAAFYPASETRAFLLENRGVAVASDAPLPHVQRPAVKRHAARVARAKAAAGVTTAPAPKPAVVAPTPAPTPAEDLALLNAPVVSAPAPVVSAPAPASVPAPIRETNRGLLLVIIGLIGVGLLALIVRAPKEVIP